MIIPFGVLIIVYIHTHTFYSFYSVITFVSVLQNLKYNIQIYVRPSGHAFYINPFQNASF